MVVRKLQKLDARIPHWDRDDLVLRDCPVCQAPDEDAVFERPDTLQIRFCGHCRTHFVSPCPSDGQLARFYADYDETHFRAPSINPKGMLKLYEKYDPFRDIRIRELSSLVRFESLKVLDIGFGRALFLYSLKRMGAIPTGLDLDNGAIELARSLGIEAFQGQLEDLGNERTFDLITLLDLVEHPLLPAAMVGKAAERLRPGGLLVIWTPNGEFAGRDENHTAFRVDLEHMQYFSPDTCLFLASELTMKVVHLETLGHPGLARIDQPLSKSRSIKHILNRICQSTPGYAAINRLRHRLCDPDERTGAYNLFCIMQKPD